MVLNAVFTPSLNAAHRVVTVFTDVRRAGNRRGPFGVYVSSKFCRSYTSSSCYEYCGHFIGVLQWGCGGHVIRSTYLLAVVVM